MIQKIKLKNFTVFEDFELEFSQGINVFIGENGTGKTHIILFQQMKKIMLNSMILI